MDARTALEILKTRMKIAKEDGNPTEQSFLYSLYNLIVVKDENVTNKSPNNSKVIQRLK